MLYISLPQRRSYVLFNSLSLSIYSIISDFSSTKIVVRGEFNVHNKEWLESTKSDRQARAAEYTSISWLIPNPTPLGHSDHYVISLLFSMELNFSKINPLSNHLALQFSKIERSTWLLFQFSLDRLRFLLCRSPKKLALKLLKWLSWGWKLYISQTQKKT